jgi:hypothetical protein
MSVFVESVIETFADPEIEKRLRSQNGSPTGVAEGVPVRRNRGRRAQQCELKRARSAVTVAVAVVAEFPDKIERPWADIGTMHRAKRSEFRAVAVMACDDDAIRQPRSR